jgi:hypothetical protein
MPSITFVSSAWKVIIIEALSKDTIIQRNNLTTNKTFQIVKDIKHLHICHYIELLMNSSNYS